ncbi:MAG: acetate--CoA ligase family protein [Gemmatimonadaceae bacterium]|nr:acetate--CoA ligase family protein [Acetobacteraceae bacterium]
MLRPRSVAVLGASNDPTRIGGRPIAYMRAQGFAGPILPVNPNRAEVQGLPAFASVADLPYVPDTAIVAVPADIAVQAIDDLGARGVRSAIVFTAGFAEMNETGAEAQERMMAAGRRHGMRLLGPNCLGLFNAHIGFYPIFSSSFENGWPVPGRIGIASQSGAYGTHMFATARNRGIGTPVCVTTGNEGDVTIGDVIGWLAEDPDTDVIAAYAEGIRQGDSFLAALAAARAARKPVVMMKVGTSTLGAHAAQSHTASIAGDDAVTDAVLAEFGVVRARTTEEMLDIATTATRRIYPARNTLGVITISGGAGVLISDAAAALGLPMPEMPAEAQARLKAMLPFAAPRNPVDCTAQAFNDMSLIGRFTDSMVDDGGYASILAFFTQVGGAASIAPRLREQLAASKARHPDRLFVLSVVAPPERIREYEADGFTVFEDPTRATVAIHAMGRFGEAFAKQPGLPPLPVPGIHLPMTSPSEAAAKRILAQAGIPAAPEAACVTVDDAVAAAERFGYPVVLKILSPDIVHKSDIGGVLLGVRGADAVRDGFTTLIDRASAALPDARLEGILVAKQLRGGTECIMGIQNDPVFGPVALFGLGGIFVEVLRDVAMHRCPFGPDVAERMIRSIRAAPILLGARGRPPADIAALAAMLSRLSAFAHQAGPRVRAIDLNPVFAMPEGEGAYAVDAMIELGDPA